MEAAWIISELEALHAVEALHFVLQGLHETSRPASERPSSGVMTSFPGFSLHHVRAARFVGRRSALRRLLCRIVALRLLLSEPLGSDASQPVPTQASVQSFPGNLVDS